MGATPKLPNWIREFAYRGYVNVYSLDGLAGEPKLFCTETLFGDWAGETLLFAKDAAPAQVIRDRIANGDPEPWRHGERGRDPMGYQTNEGVAKIAKLFHGSKLYGSALAHMLKEGDQTSGPLKEFRSGPLHFHLKRVLEFVVENMPNLKVIVSLGVEAHWLVTACVQDDTAATLRVGECTDIALFKRRILLARLYHTSRPFPGGWEARRGEWQAVASEINMRVAEVSSASRRTTGAAADEREC